MVEIVINYLAVFVAAVLNMVLGMAWYGPLFGKQWMDLMQIKKADVDKSKKKGMGKTYVVAFAMALLMFYVLAHVVAYMGAVTAVLGAITGFWMWLGFIMPLEAGSVLWEGRPVKVFLLNAGYHLVALLVGGAVLALWA